MKIIIIEGPDNTGKNTLIQNIIDNNDVVKLIHCHKPDNDSLDPFGDMKDIYLKYLNDVIEDYRKNNIDVVVFNRYYQSEYIYGQMYRNGNPDIIKKLIDFIEVTLLKNIYYEDIYYVQLTSSSAELLVKNEDGKSLSEGKLDKINKELDLFDKVFDISKINKHKIYINENNDFRTREDILIEFNDFINI